MPRIWWVLGLVLVGCFEPAETPSTETDGLPDVSKIFADVSRLRELQSDRVPRTQFLRPGEYQAATKRLGDAEHDGVDAYAQQLGLAPGRMRVRDEQARLLASDGLYAQSTGTIYVLDDPNRRFPILLEQVVAHESVHALQHQHGLLPDPHQSFGGDEALARRALIEGDATVGMLLYEQREWQTPIRRLAERVRRGFADQPISRYVGETNMALRNAPAYQQELVLFPYRAGAAFVGTLLTSGGYALVGEAFKKPPRATAQVLHPERYARGEEPVSVPPAQPASGYSASRTGVLGELLLRSQLLRCNPEARAIDAAEGWRGDNVTFMTRGSSELVAQQWLMDSEDNARALAEALRASCDGVSAPFVLQRGARVVAIRGGDTPIASQVASAWSSTPLENSPLVRPLGTMDLPALPPRHLVAEPYAEDGTLYVPEAGVALPIPKGFAFSAEHPQVLRNSNAHASIEIHPQLGEYFEGAPRQILRGVSRSMELAIAYSNVVADGEPHRIALGVGQGSALGFEHEGTVARGRVIAIPRCGGAGLLAVVQYFGDGQEAVENAALSKLRAIDDERFCKTLAH